MAKKNGNAVFAKLEKEPSLKCMQPEGSQEFMLTTAAVCVYVYSFTLLASLDLSLHMMPLPLARKQHFLNASVKLDRMTTPVGRKPLILSVSEVWNCT